MSQKQTSNYAMVIDTSRCFDCKACMIACKVENDVPKGSWRNWVKHDGGDTGRRTQFQPGQCMQCDEPSCVAACPVGATYKQDNALVVIDPAKCIGCGNCISACPYGARYLNPTVRTADKCDFCEHRLRRGDEPACVETCPTKARIFGDLDDPESSIAKLMESSSVVQLIHPKINTMPRIYYMEGTSLLDWPKEPTLPGNVHMPPDFWKG